MPHKIIAQWKKENYKRKKVIAFMSALNSFNGGFSLFWLLSLLDSLLGYAFFIHSKYKSIYICVRACENAFS